jgi:hypothetical protein
VELVDDPPPCRTVGDGDESDMGGSTSEGTELTEPPAGPSVVTVELELPQLVQGAATAAGLA